VTGIATSHNPEVAGSNPAPTTAKAPQCGAFAFKTTAVASAGLCLGMSCLATTVREELRRELERPDDRIVSVSVLGDHVCDARSRRTAAPAPPRLVSEREAEAVTSDAADGSEIRSSRAHSLFARVRYAYMHNAR
jgi:hypothetical protein